MFSWGTINGKGLNMRQLRPVVIEAQAAMKAGYSAAYESARGKPGAAEVYERIAALPEKIGKVRQPGGEQLDLIGLYKGALGAIGELWAYGQKAIAASGEAGVAASWGLKKVRTYSLPCSSFLNPSSPHPKCTTLSALRWKPRLRRRSPTL